MANSAVVGILRVVLTANAAEYESVLKQAQSSAKTFATETKKIGAQLSNAGSALTAGLTLPLLGTAAAAIKVGMDFDKVTNQIQGVLQPTAAQMENVRATAMKMGADTVFSAVDAAEAILELGKAGFETETAISSVGDVLQLAAASGLSMGDSASMAARSLNAFGLQASDLSHVNDVLAKAVNSTSLEIGDLQVAFGYIGPIAQGFGMSIEQASAALGIMRDSGIAAETTGRALREGMGRLANPVKAVKDVMGDLGIASFETNGKLMGLNEIVGTLQTHGLTAAQSLKLFGDAAGPGMFALVQKGQFALENLTKSMKESDGAAKKMADAMMQGLPGAMEQLKGSVETALLGISKAIEPAVISLTGIAKSLADSVTTVLVPAFMALPQPVQMATLGMLGVAAAAGPALLIMGQLAMAASALTTAFTANGVATLALSAAGRGFAANLPTLTAALSALYARVTVTTGALSIMTGVLSGLGVMVAIAGAAFAGWQIGKWLGEVTGLTDGFGKLSAKVLEFLHILPAGTAAQYDAMRAAERAKEAQGGLADGLDATAAAAKALQDRVKGEGLARDVATLGKTLSDLATQGKATPDVLKRAGMEAAALKQRGAVLTPELEKLATAFSGLPAPVHAAAEELTDAQKAVKRLKDELSGKDAIDAAKMMVDVVTEIGGATKLTTDQQKKALAVLDDAIEKYEALGKVAPEAWTSLQKQLSALPNFEIRVKINRAAAKEAIEDLQQQLLMWRDFRINTKLLIPTISPEAGGLDLSKTWEPFKKGIRDSRDGVVKLGDTINANVVGVLESLPATMARAFEGGGNLGGAFLSIAVQLGDTISKSITDALQKSLEKVGKSITLLQKAAVSIGSAAATAIGGAFGGGTGATISGMAASIGGAVLMTTALGAAAATSATAALALGAATAGIGAAAVGVFLVAKHFFTVGKEVKEARKNLDDFHKTLDAVLTAQQKAASGGQEWAARLIQVRDALIQTGVAASEAEARAEKLVAALLNTNNPAGSRAAMQEIAQLMQRVVDARETASSLFDEIMEASAHGIPAAMKPAIDQLIALGLLTDEQVAKLKKLGDGSEIDVDQLKSDIDSIGGRLESLGPAFQQANIDQTAGKYINSIDRMIKAGGDVGGILFDAREEISGLVTDSLKFGTTLPANMKPWIEELARSGNLIDANGQKITDISNLKFGDKIETEQEKTDKMWQTILQSIKDLIDAIKGPLAGAINGLPNEKRIKIVYDEEGKPTGDGDGANKGDKGHAVGTMGRYGEWFANFGKGTRTTLHGMEAVLTKAQAVPFAMSVMDSMMPSVPAFNPAMAMAGIEGALSVGGSSSTVTNSVNVLPVIMPGQRMSSREIGREAARYLSDSGLGTDAHGVTTAVEHVIDNWFRTYGSRR